MRINEVFDFINSKIYIQQLRFEAVSLGSLIKEYIPETKVIMEIGLREGGNLCFLCSCLVNTELAIGIEPELEKPFDILKVVGQLPHLVRFHHIKLDSHMPETFQQVVDILKGQKVDVLFIDGDHTRTGVSLDFTTYRSLVRSPGVIVIHDVNMSQYIVKGVNYNLRPEETVAGYWQDVLCKQYPNIVISAASDLCGMGVLFI